MAARTPSGAALAIHDTLDSTSAEARRRFDAGETGPVWILAKRQTSGYGRRGRAWSQDLGDLAATWLAPAPQPIETAGQLSFVVALAVSDALAQAAPGAEIALKWPNDVLIGGAKAAGLLLELWTASGRASAVGIGVGVNVVSRPEGMPYPTARLLDVAAKAPSPEELVVTIDAALDQWRRMWARDGFAPVRAAWIARAHGLGGPIRVRLPDAELDGDFVDVDDDGALVLQCGEARRRISAGEVFFGAKPGG